MATSVDRSWSAMKPIRLLIAALIVGGVVFGSMNCAAGLAAAHVPVATTQDCRPSDAVVADGANHRSTEGSSHGQHSPDAVTANDRRSADGPFETEYRSAQTDHSERPSGPPHHAAEAHPGMACVVMIEIATPTVSATITTIDLMVADSAPKGRSPEPDPPVPKFSSTPN